jgi:hypothetical protein
MKRWQAPTHIPAELIGDYVLRVVQSLEDWVNSELHSPASEAEPEWDHSRLSDAAWAEWVIGT